MRYFYPRSPRGERRQPAAAGDLHRVISIHAPREGSDRRSTRKRVKSARNFYPRSPRGERRKRYHRRAGGRPISIHAPREGSDAHTSHRPCLPQRFLSTLPARGATYQRDRAESRQQNFYPRSPRGERPLSSSSQISAPNFYPRSPRGERQEQPWPEEEEPYFYPRSPRGERRAKRVDRAQPSGFLSTLPARGATARASCAELENGISIHAPREGSDRKAIRL